MIPKSTDYSAILYILVRHEVGVPKDSWISSREDLPPPTLPRFWFCGMPRERPRRGLTVLMPDLHIAELR